MNFRRSPRGFTLIEVLAAVLLTGITIASAVGFYINLSTATRRATELTEGGRRAAGVLDRVARDLEGAFLLVKPPELDPLEHPWLFLAEEGHASDGAERLKFVTRSVRPRGAGGRPGGISVVTYLLAEDEGEGFALYRFTRPGLPDGLDRSFPSVEDAGASLLAEGLASFQTRFLDANGQWVGSWDSSTLADSSQLPLAAEIRVAVLDAAFAGEAADELDGPTPYIRRVVLPVRPLNLASLIESRGEATDVDNPPYQNFPGPEDIDRNGDGIFEGPGGIDGSLGGGGGGGGRRGGGGGRRGGGGGGGGDGDGGDSGSGSGEEDSSADSESGPDSRLQACMNVHRGEIVALVGAAVFNRYYNAAAGSLDNQFAWSLVNQYGLSCP